MNIWYILLAVLIILPVPMIVRNNMVPRNLGPDDSGRLGELPSSPNAVSSQTDDLSRRVEPLPFIGSLSESRQRLVRAAEAYGRVRLIRDEPNYLHMVFTTALMRYKDDVEFLFVEEDRTIHVRSASRIGYSDMGLNRSRYDQLRLFYLENPELP